jgi:hypothetical protein
MSISTVLTAELLEALRDHAQHSTEFMRRVAGQSVNNVLEVFSGTFPTEGYITRDYAVAAGCIEVNNLGIAGHIVTVVSSGPGGTTAPTGQGSYVIDGGTVRTVAVASRHITIWGTSGDRFAFQTFTAAIVPGTA